MSKNWAGVLVCPNLDRLGQWDEVNSVKLNKAKMLGPALGSQQSHAGFGAEWLKSCPSETSLRLLFDCQLTTSQECAYMGKETNSILLFSRNSMARRSRELIVPLYSALARPHLEYGSQFWVLHCKKHILLLVEGS